MSDWEKLQAISADIQSMAPEFEKCKQLLENIEANLTKILK